MNPRFTFDDDRRNGDGSRSLVDCRHEQSNSPEGPSPVCLNGSFFGSVVGLVDAFFKPRRLRREYGVYGENIGRNDKRFHGFFFCFEYSVSVTAGLS